jgi:hypothetical protein
MLVPVPRQQFLAPFVKKDPSTTRLPPYGCRPLIAKTFATEMVAKVFVIMPPEPGGRGPA